MQQRIESIATPAEFGESSTESFDVEFHRHVAEESAFHADESNLVVVLPGHVIARADVNIFVGQTFADDGLHRFGLRGLLRSEPAAIEHVQEIGVAAGVQLISALKLYAALPEKIDHRAMQRPSRPSAL